MICKICGKKTRIIYKAIILRKYNIKYFYCSNCGFLQTEEPYWLNEAYKEPINVSDTGYLRRNIYLSKKITILINFIFDKNGKYLDYAGGYGVFTRLMRDIGFDFYWYDKYTQNLFAKGFEYKKAEKIELITTFESFEHFVNPIKEIENMLNISDNIIFTTKLLPNPIPEPKDWWYYGLDHGQHISFYSERTMFYIANKYGINYYKINELHIFTNKIIPFYTKTILKLSKFGFHKLIQKWLKSKTWQDYIKMTNVK